MKSRLFYVLAFLLGVIAASDFKASSMEIGPAASWIPKFGHDRVLISATWLHDVEATNRMKGDYEFVNVTVKF